MRKVIKHLISSLSYNCVSHLSKGDESDAILSISANGKSFCRTYWFHEDKDHIYFDWLSVNEDDRKNGLATFLIKCHISAAKRFNLNSLLWVKKKETWMHEWYKRLGYSDWKDYEQEENAVWMIMENKQ